MTQTAGSGKRSVSPPVAACVSRSDPAAHDPNWWAGVMTGTLGGPLLVVLTGSMVDLLAARPVVIAASLLLPVVVAAPTWFIARTMGRRRVRRVTAGLACAVGIAYPVLVRAAEALSR
ncbi:MULTISPECIES: hypothetical protein [Streptomyces]|uniref:hypothetical protein n=1 Tax=Streptomyces TaxID=1883 RepID=UPI0012FF4B2E|nr:MULTISPECIES: hypothetical protein [Streptomyces]